MSKINGILSYNGVALLTSTYVSAHKNKMGFFHSSTEKCNKNSQLNTDGYLLKGV